jgi:hypothetical protein
MKQNSQHTAEEVYDQSNQQSVYVIVFYFIYKYCLYNILYRVATHSNCLINHSQQMDVHFLVDNILCPPVWNLSAGLEGKGKNIYI